VTTLEASGDLVRHTVAAQPCKIVGLRSLLRAGRDAPPERL
jgi:hypothetical protein